MPPGETDAAADPVLLPIIMYHEVKPDKPGKDAIQPWEFEADLKWLADNGYTTIVMADLIAYVRDGTPLPEKPIILSFDDGYYNNYVYVLPLLQQYSARIVLSLLGRNTDDFTGVAEQEHRLCARHVGPAQRNARHRPRRGAEPLV